MPRRLFGAAVIAAVLVVLAPVAANAYPPGQDPVVSTSSSLFRAGARVPVTVTRAEPGCTARLSIQGTREAVVERVPPSGEVRADLLAPDAAGSYLVVASFSGSGCTAVTSTTMIRVEAEPTVTPTPDPTTVTPRPPAPTTATPQPTTARPTATSTATTTATATATASPAPVPPSPVTSPPAPGTAILVVDGEEVPVTITPTQERDGLIVRGGGITLKVISTDEEGTPIPLAPDGSLIVEYDGPLVLTGAGFPPGAVVTLWLFSDPVDLGTTTVDPKGRIDASTLVPDTVLPGRHTLQVAGADRDRASGLLLTIGVIIEAAETTTPTAVSLAGTAQAGSSWPWLLVLLLALLVVVVAFGVTRRVRQH